MLLFCPGRIFSFANLLKSDQTCLEHYFLRSLKVWNNYQLVSWSGNGCQMNISQHDRISLRVCRHHPEPHPKLFDQTHGNLQEISKKLTFCLIKTRANMSGRLLLSWIYRRHFEWRMPESIPCFLVSLSFACIRYILFQFITPTQSKNRQNAMKVPDYIKGRPYLWSGYIKTRKK